MAYLTVHALALSEFAATDVHPWWTSSLASETLWDVSVKSTLRQLHIRELTDAAIVGSNRSRVDNRGSRLHVYDSMRDD